MEIPIPTLPCNLVLFAYTEAGGMRERSISEDCTLKWFDEQPVNNQAQLHIKLFLIIFFFLSYSQQRDVKMQKVGMECLYRLVWLVF